MNEDMVIVPLRVPKEQRRQWRMEAGKEDKSVQQWLLSRLSVRVAQIEQGATKSGRNPEVGGKAAGGNPVTHSKLYPGGSINPMNALICCVCGKEIQGEGYTYNKEKKPICQPCAHKVAGV